MRYEAQALLLNGLMAVTGMVLGAFLDLSPRGAIETGAVAMAVTLAAVLPALRNCPTDEEDDQ
ncbi:hypothetical protein [Actinomadura sp. HBU206391]|uniref:hypothetical protein n=1 Tax=Actinomadura sp. HBU206391 TaxID=2731692 RepID=UPI00164F50EF|nr:hypothetical protein [Actinomadura sp. HBU206391]MBC6458451.1 hypothetical protein [Actinomadura sp. HBU206391]